MQTTLITALVGLGAELVATWADKRRRRREIAQLERLRQERERALLRRRTKDRIRLAKLRYRAQRAAEEARRRELERIYDDLRWELDANPYGADLGEDIEE